MFSAAVDHAAAAGVQLTDLLSLPLAQYAIAAYVAWRYRYEIIGFVGGVAGEFAKAFKAGMKP